MFIPSLPPTRGTFRNRLLKAMPATALDYLWPQFEWVPLVVKTALLVPGEAVDHVYFVEQGSVSMISMLENGEEIEVGMVGPEGMVGLPVLLGAPTSPSEAIVQGEGVAHRLSAAAFRQAMAQVPEMMAPLLRYVDSFLFQVSHTAVCNGHHQIEQRLARWILMTQDRVGGDCFTMTQQFMSYMLGVQRPSITLAVGQLQRAGLIRHGRGEMQVVDRSGLEGVACECYRAVQERFTWLNE